ncbi:MAG TPA: hypothetical protein VES68_00375, partial [Candidatus Sulfotelmatobacter sp.]|nr:hypothetical protein [Candidatus Sulfotelmatobacter sp.]
NGIAWHGGFNISYIERYHSKTYWMGQGTNQKLYGWLTEFDNSDLPEFTPWNPTSYQAEVILQNGKWIVKESQFTPRESSNNLIGGFKVPYDPKDELTCGSSCPADFQPKTIK